MPHPKGIQWKNLSTKEVAIETSHFIGVLLVFLSWVVTVQLGLVEFFSSYGVYLFKLALRGFFLSDWFLLNMLVILSPNKNDGKLLSLFLKSSVRWLS